MTNTLAIVILVLSAIILLAGISCLGFVLYKVFSRRYELTERTVYYNSNITMDIPQLLNDIINESFLDYKVSVLAARQMDYINEEEENTIKRDLASMVAARMSDAAIAKLSLFYNKNNLPAIIAEKINIIVMDYVVNNNRPK